MTAANFRTADELVQYVNDGSILQADIVSIEVRDGRWYIFHY